jgi:hypothetical protein
MDKMTRGFSYYKLLFVLLPVPPIPVWFIPSWHYECGILQSYIYIGEKHHAGLKTAILVAFSLRYYERTKGEISKFYRDLYGYESYPHYWRYRSRKTGFLDIIMNIRYEKWMILILKEDQRRVISFLRRSGAEILKWKVIPGSSERKKLGLQAP